MTTLEELIKRAGARDCRLTRRTATSWVSAGLLPPLHGRGMGHGRGRRYSWKERDVVDRAVAAQRLLGQRARLAYALAGLCYAGYRVEPKKALHVLLLEAKRVRASIPRGARSYRGVKVVDRLGAMAGSIASRIAAQHKWDRDATNAASDLVVQVLAAYAGLEHLDVNDVSDLLKVLFADSWSGQAHDGQDAAGAFIAELLDALSLPNRIRILRSVSPRDFQRTQRYWRAGLLLLRRLATNGMKATHSVSFDDRLMISVLAGGSGFFHLMLEIIVRGGEPRLRASFLLLAGRLRQLVGGEDGEGQPLVELFAIWDEWRFGIGRGRAKEASSRC